jgi:hypothetical protein
MGQICRTREEHNHTILIESQGENWRKGNRPFDLEEAITLKFKEIGCEYVSRVEETHDREKMFPFLLRCFIFQFPYSRKIRAAGCLSISQGRDRLPTSVHVKTTEESRLLCIGTCSEELITF